MYILIATQAKILSSTKYRFSSESYTIDAYISKPAFIVKPFSIEVFNSSVSSLNNSPTHTITIEMAVHINSTANWSFCHWIDQTVQTIDPIFRRTSYQIIFWLLLTLFTSYHTFRSMNSLVQSVVLSEAALSAPVSEQLEFFLFDSYQLCVPAL